MSTSILRQPIKLQNHNYVSRYQPFYTRHTQSASPVDWLPRLYIDCPLHVDPWDCHIGGRQEPSLHIWVDTSSYPHACIGGPLQKAL